MSLAAGSRLGPYEVVAPIGAGGMGEVFRGRDTRLDRTVAIKVLPSHLSSSPQLRERFDREARAISHLNHPNICTLYDVGHDNGTDFIVMEYLEGESLADRIVRGPLPMHDVLRYGSQIAAALHLAHKAGITHRDLKPGNVMITASGAKLLDFGLARISVANSGPSVFSGAASKESPTEHKPLTQEGTVIGTFQYMAPEQLEGTEADARTDIFALGAVLYEMATGRRAFTGKNKTSLFAAIIDREPTPIAEIQPMTPRAFERVVQGCLAKDPEDRWQTAHDVKKQLDGIAEGGAENPVVPSAAPARSSRALAVATAVLLLVSLLLGALWWRSRGQEPSRVVLAIVPPQKVIPIFGGSGSIAISPDGKLVAFVGSMGGGKTSIYVRPVSGDEAHPLAGTEGGQWPFWSSDSLQIGFVSGGKLRRIDAVGGPSQVICDVATDARGATWSGATILFAPSARGGIYSVAQSGGIPVPATQLDPNREYSHRFPSFLPDGKHFLYDVQTFGTTAQQRGTICAGQLGSMTRTLVTRANSPAQYANGYLFFSRERALLAQRFDPDKLTTSGEPTLVAERVNYVPGNANAAFAVRDHLLVYSATQIAKVNLTWVDRTGRAEGVAGSPGVYLRPRISHDSRRVTFEALDEASGSSGILVFDTTRGATTRLTFDEGEDNSPIWSPDDRQIAYTFENLKQGTREIHSRPTGGGQERILLRNTSFHQLYVNDWSKDGKYILFHRTDEKGATNSYDVSALSVADGKVMNLVATPAAETNARFSPDARWFAYQSNESGQSEVYVQRFPPTGEKWQISTNGGAGPLWRADGKEILMVSGGSVFSVEVKTSDSFEAGVPKALFAPPLRTIAGTATPDHVHLLLALPVDEDVNNSMTAVLNWKPGLQK